MLALLATAGLWYACSAAASAPSPRTSPTPSACTRQNEVTIQGIPVGSVDDDRPAGRRRAGDPQGRQRGAGHAPNPQAVIVAPTLVSDRYVQLGPTYEGGPQLADGAVIPVEKTGTPVELDRVYQSLDTISRALGPNGANQAGALNQLLRSSAGALGGNGELLKSTITELGGAVGTLADNRDNLFATVDNLGQFTNMLARNDGAVRDLNNQLADISAFLASERGNLSTVLATLPPALDDVARFIRDNRDILRTDVRQLANITDILVRQRAALTEFANVAPLALGNLHELLQRQLRHARRPPGASPRAHRRRARPARAAVQPAGQPARAAGRSWRRPRRARCVTQVARASVVCGAILGRRHRAPGPPLGLSLAPIQDLLNLLNAQPSLDALVARDTGCCRGRRQPGGAGGWRHAGSAVPALGSRRRPSPAAASSASRTSEVASERAADGPRRGPRAHALAALLVVALFALTGCGLQLAAGPPAARWGRARPRALHGDGAVHQRRRPRAEQQRARQRRPGRRRPGRSRSRPTAGPRRSTVEVNGAVVLPANATARLRQTSLLGEKFVELHALARPTRRRAGWPPARSSRPTAPTSVRRSRRCSARCRCCSTAVASRRSRRSPASSTPRRPGNEAQLRSLLSNLDQFVGTLDRQKADIVRAIDSLERLSRTLVDQRARIANVIDNLGPGPGRAQPAAGPARAAPCSRSNRLSDVGTDVIRRSQANTVADLRALQPILRNLVEAGDALPGLAPDPADDPVRGQLAQRHQGRLREHRRHASTSTSRPSSPTSSTAPRSPAWTRSSSCCSRPGTTPAAGAARHGGHGRPATRPRTAGPTPALPGLSGGNGG